MNSGAIELQPTAKSLPQADVLRTALLFYFIFYLVIIIICILTVYLQLKAWTWHSISMVIFIAILLNYDKVWSNDKNKIM